MSSPQIIPHEYYPELNSRMDVFVSDKNLEGGSVSTLGAYLSNLLEVALKSGFRYDWIEDGKHGLIFKIDTPYEKRIEMKKKLFQLNQMFTLKLQIILWRIPENKISLFFYG